MDFNGLSFPPFSAITRNSLKWSFAVWIWPSATDDENYHKTLCCAITEQEKRNDLMREANVRSFIIVRLKSHHGWCFAICNSILGEVYCARRLIHWLFCRLMIVREKDFLSYLWRRVISLLAQNRSTNMQRSDSVIWRLRACRIIGHLMRQKWQIANFFVVPDFARKQSNKEGEMRQ